MDSTTIGAAARAADTEGRPEFRPVADYGLLADCNCAALVDREGSVDWLCLPRYDSASVFARILDPAAGHWSIRPAGEFSAERRYLPGTLVIETTFSTERGSVRLTDALAFPEGQRGHDLGLDTPHELLRSVEGVSGSVDLELELAPRPEYGLYRPLIRLLDDGARSFGGTSPVRLRSGAPVELDAGSSLRSSFRVGEGESVGFSMRWLPVEAATPPEPTAPGDVARPHRGDGRGVALLGGRARHLRGPAPRAGQAQRTRTQGTHLPAHGRDRRGPHHLAARDRRR